MMLQSILARRILIVLVVSLVGAMGCLYVLSSDESIVYEFFLLPEPRHEEGGE